MNVSRQSNRSDDLPLAVATFATSFGRGQIGCVIMSGNLFGVGYGENAELDAITSFGISLQDAVMYVTRIPNETVLKFVEKCGLSKLVIMQNRPEGEDPSMKCAMCVEYVGSCIYRIRDMMRALEQGASI